jgi:hypothetical protein
MTPDQTPFPLIGAELERQVEAALKKLRGISAGDAGRPVAPGQVHLQHHLDQIRA